MPASGIFVRTNYFFTLGLISVVWIASYIALSPPDLPKLENSPPASLITDLPTFSQISNTQKRKLAFFDYLLPKIKNENAHITKLRKQIKVICELNSGKIGHKTSNSEIAWLHELAEFYELDISEQSPITCNRLLSHINTIPPSLALAQAAIESGWGSSRFAREGNNLFGHWCFKEGCGLVPSKRSDNRHHEVAKFADINSSIRAYLKNLNSFSAYAKLRSIRRKLPEGETIDSLMLLPGLKKYSEQGQAYIDKVRNMINSNNLRNYDSNISSSGKT